MPTASWKYCPVATITRIGSDQHTDRDGQDTSMNIAGNRQDGYANEVRDETGALCSLLITFSVSGSDL
jgi:hypothetical protein